MKFADIKPRNIHQSQKSFYSYEIPRIIKLMEAVNRMVVDRDRGGWEMEFGCSFLSDSVQPFL